MIIYEKSYVELHNIKNLLYNADTKVTGEV